MPHLKGQFSRWYPHLDGEYGDGGPSPLMRKGNQREGGGDGPPNLIGRMNEFASVGHNFNLNVGLKKSTEGLFSVPATV